MRTRRTFGLIGLSIVSLLFINLAGCAVVQRKAPPVAEKMPLKEEIEITAPPPAPVEFNGSLYDARSNFNGFFIEYENVSLSSVQFEKIVFNNSLLFSGPIVLY